MSDQLVDVRTLLAASAGARVERGRDGVLHVLVGPLTLHLSRAACEELTTTLARAVLTLAKSDETDRPALQLLRGGSAAVLVSNKIEPERMIPSKRTP